MPGALNWFSAPLVFFLLPFLILILLMTRYIDWLHQAKMTC